MGGEVLNPWKGRRPEEGEATEDSNAEQSVDVDQDANSEPDTDGNPETAVLEVEADAEEEGSSLEKELEELQDRHIRLAAEFDNFRKRTRKEQSEFRTIAQADLLLEVLPTLDDLARVADIPNESTTVEALDEGIELILRNLGKKLEVAGLVRIDAIDQAFNPEFHQGILTVDVDDEALDETVSRVFVDGYTFSGRLVRPAQVEVRRFVSEPESDSEPEPDPEPDSELEE
jgi:molecular chaperone GrpE